MARKADEIVTTPLWQQYDRGLNFNRTRNLFTDTDRNFRFYNGDQWDGLKSGSIEPLSFNIIQPIVKYKVGIINANNWQPIYSNMNYTTPEFQVTANKVCDLFNKRAAKVWENDSMDSKVRRVSKQSCINSEGVIYVNYDDNKNDPVNEIVSKNNIFYGNENSSDIQSQPYIIISARKPVSEVKRLAEEVFKLSPEAIELIVGDNQTQEQAGDSAKEEVNDMCLLITKMYKLNGTVWVDQATKTVELQKGYNSKLSLYPVEHMIWEEVEGSSRGEGDVKYIIPNQIELNKTIMRRAIAVKEGAYPKKVANVNKILNPGDIDKVGATIKVNDLSVDDVRKILGFIQPSAMSGDSEKLQNELINTTRELKGAGDIATGNVNPEQASGKSILAVSQVNQMPLTEQTVELKRMIEGLSRIWIDMWKVYNPDGITLLEEKTVQEQGPDDQLIQRVVEVPVKIDPTTLEKMKFNVKIDVTPKTPYDRFAKEMSLENLLKAKEITFEEYVKLLEFDSVMPKQQLEEVLEDRKKNQSKINEMQLQAELMHDKINQKLAQHDDINAMQQQGEQMMQQGPTQ